MNSILKKFQKLFTLFIFAVSNLYSFLSKAKSTIRDKRRRKTLTNKSCQRFRKRRLSKLLISSTQVVVELSNQRSWKWHWGRLVSSLLKKTSIHSSGNSIKTSLAESISTSSWRLWLLRWVKLTRKKLLTRHSTSSTEMVIKRLASTIWRAWLWN